MPDLRGLLVLLLSVAASGERFSDYVYWTAFRWVSASGLLPMWRQSSLRPGQAYRCFLSARTVVVSFVHL